MPILIIVSMKASFFRHISTVTTTGPGAFKHPLGNKFRIYTVTETGIKEIQYKNGTKILSVMPDL